MDIHYNEKYKLYQNDKASVVPTEILKGLVSLFIETAALNLGAKATKADVDQIIYFIQSPRFNFLPINVILSAFTRGSLGKLKNDKTTLTPRNIHDWLDEVSLEHRNYQEHLQRDYTLSNPEVHFKDLTRYPLGKAICKKIDWYKSGAINSNDWDAISLRELAEMIGKDVMPTLEKFNLTDRREL